MPLSGHGSRAAPEGSAWVSASQTSKRGGGDPGAGGGGGGSGGGDGGSGGGGGGSGGGGGFWWQWRVLVAVTAGRPLLACVQLTYIHTPSCDFYFMCSLAVCEVQLSHM